MNEQVSGTDDIHDLIDIETRHIDVVASWENLYSAYDTLRFTDHLSDNERLDEFKWVVQQMNAFLTRIRTKLLICKDIDAMLETLSQNVVPKGKTELVERRALVYQKLKQQWIKSLAIRLNTMREEEQDA